jgi:hypothetical protein
MTVTISAATLTSLLMESVFYGLFLVTFFQTIYTLVFACDALKRGAVRWTFVLVACGMFILGTLDLLLLFKHSLDDFVRFHGPGGPDALLADMHNWVNPTRVSQHLCPTSSDDADCRMRRPLCSCSRSYSEMECSSTAAL